MASSSTATATSATMLPSLRATQTQPKNAGIVSFKLFPT